MYKIGLSIIIILFAAGCSVHPLPENVTGLPTTAIVNHIRCEARYAFAKATGYYLASTSETGSYGSAAAQDLVSRALDISELDINKLDDVQKRNINKYLPAAIAYDFTFDMTEDGTASALLDVGNVFTRSVFNIGIAGGIDVSRQNIRNFRITDTFAELRASRGYCTRYREGENFVYPITGEIGLTEMVMTFVDLNQFQSLSPAKDAKDKAPTMADQLTFLTTLAGSLTPKITLTPLNKGARISDVSGILKGSRKDSHKVIVAISLPPMGNQRGCEPPSLILNTQNLRNFNRTPAERCAIAEIDNQVQRNIITNLAVRPTF